MANQNFVLPNELSQLIVDKLAEDIQHDPRTTKRTLKSLSLVDSSFQAAVRPVLFSNLSIDLSVAAYDPQFFKHWLAFCETDLAATVTTLHLHKTFQMLNDSLLSTRNVEHPPTQHLAAKYQEFAGKLGSLVLSRLPMLKKLVIEVFPACTNPFWQIVLSALAEQDFFRQLHTVRIFTEPDYYDFLNDNVGPKIRFACRSLEVIIVPIRQRDSRDALIHAADRSCSSALEASSYNSGVRKLHIVTFDEKVGLPNLIEYEDLTHIHIQGLSKELLGDGSSVCSNALQAGRAEIGGRVPGLGYDLLRGHHERWLQVLHISGISMRRTNWGFVLMALRGSTTLRSLRIGSLGYDTYETSELNGADPGQLSEVRPGSGVFSPLLSDTTWDWSMFQNFALVHPLVIQPLRGDAQKLHDWLVGNPVPDLIEDVIRSAMEVAP